LETIVIKWLLVARVAYSLLLGDVIFLRIGLRQSGGFCVFSKMTKRSCAKFFSGFRKSHLFITPCIEKQCTRPSKKWRAICSTARFSQSNFWIAGLSQCRTHTLTTWQPWFTFMFLPFSSSNCSDDGKDFEEY